MTEKKDKKYPTIRVSPENKKILERLATLKQLITAKRQTPDAVISDLLKFKNDLTYANAVKLVRKGFNSLSPTFYEQLLILE